MKLIDISTKKYPNMFTMVDDADFDWLNQWKWHANKNGHVLYAERRKYNPKKRIKMHRLILNVERPFQVDHKNGNGLDNQRHNIRPCTNTENTQNSRKCSAARTSKFKGVCYAKERKRFRSEISVNSKRIHLGYFKSEIEAAIAYDDAAKIHFTEFAHINFPIT